MQACENVDKAASMNSRAAGIELQAEHAIYSDDPDVLERLAEKLAGLEAQREAMTARNAEYRRTHRAKLKAQPSAYERGLMVPHASYELQNLGGTITRTRQRIAALSGRPAPPEAAQGETATARAGITIAAGMTTPSRPGKAPRPVWNVGGSAGSYRALMTEAGGSWYRGAFSFWDDPTEAIEAALMAREQEMTR